MGLEPGLKQLGTATGKYFSLFTRSIPVSLILISSSAFASSHFESFFNWSTGADSQSALREMVQRAEQILKQSTQFAGFTNDKAIAFNADKAVGDAYSTTIKFKQTYKGIEVVGKKALFHYDSNGDLRFKTDNVLNAVLNVKPKLSVDDAIKILNDRYQTSVVLSEPAALKVILDSSGAPHLTYHIFTRTQPKHVGQQVFVDAHNGSIVIETDRIFTTSDRGRHTIYSANTDKARENVDVQGLPTDINFDWYDKAYEDDEMYPEVADRSATSALRNGKRVYTYFDRKFNRKSYDNKDTRIKSIVHIGVKMNNAFWFDEYGVMAYGDGDDEHLTDLTRGLDVTGHEITHGVITNTANLQYQGESGALNESYADFFGKMIDYTEDDWDIGAKIIADASKEERRALRNMMDPEEFEQPGTNDSPLRIPTTGSCNNLNDRCGVHTNSGIPNRAAALIVEEIGKEKAEQLYYKVLSQHLTETSGFADARKETEKACELMYGKDSEDCAAVTEAFATVKM